MKVVIQRVKNASVSINRSLHNAINEGLLVLVGIGEEDGNEDIEWLCAKIVNLRIFNDSDSKMNLSLKEINGEVLLISQFTLFANTKKGNRPSFTQAAKPEVAIPLYQSFINQLKKELLPHAVKTGVFGADMQVELLNDGPVTILIDSKNRA